MKRVVITGAAGFLGSHLAKELITAGDEVIGIDNFSTGCRKNIDALIEHARFHLIHYDVSDESICTLEELQQVDEIYHLASPASPKFYTADPLGTIHANTLGTRNMLELARRQKAKILYASTSEAYGDPLVNPQPEYYRGNVNTWGPRACYDESKRLGEVYCYEYHRLYGVQAKVVRIFNTYSAGLRNDDGRVISNFVTQALTGKDITVYGDGSQTRSFCYVDDTIAGLRRVMECDQATGEIINIGSPYEYTIFEVAKIIKRLTASDSRITFLELPQDDPKVRRPNIDKAKRLLDWEPRITLEEGLKRTIETYRRQLLQSEVKA